MPSLSDPRFLKITNNNNNNSRNNSNKNIFVVSKSLRAGRTRTRVSSFDSFNNPFIPIFGRDLSLRRSTLTLCNSQLFSRPLFSCSTPLFCPFPPRRRLDVGSFFFFFALRECRQPTPPSTASTAAAVDIVHWISFGYFSA